MSTKLLGEDRDQHFEALRPARAGRQDRRREPDTLGALADPVTHARAAHGDRTDAGHDLALGQAPATPRPPAAVVSQIVGMAAEQGRNLGFDGLRQQRAGAFAQNIGQRISKSSWLAELENISLAHSISLLRWRSGGVEHPHDTPPNTHSRYVIATAAALILLMPPASAQDVLKVASADRGVWELAAPELGQRAGIFRKHGIVLDFSHTRGDDETFERVLSGQVDVGLGVDTVRVLRAYVRGAPVRIVGANVTGASNYWYVLATSSIRALKDLFGKSIAYAANGSPSHYDALDFNKEFRLNAKLVPTGGMAATFKELAANRVDVGWGAPPFGMEEMEKGKIRIIGRANEVAKIRGKTISVLITNATTLERRQDLLARFMRAYRESVDWMYTDPAALKHYAECAGVSEQLAQRLRDEFFPKFMLSPEKVTGLKLIMKDANLKLSRRKVSEVVQVPSTGSYWKPFFAR